MHKKEKIFRDPIYGYISIPIEYCNYFIDNVFFQRLRRIEQTSMRVLYPSAHHDRFAHSIGVYYLGSIAFKSIINNSKSYFPDIKKEDWEVYKKTFEIACLLHDIGHSPFSHTFEHLFLYNQEEKILERLSNFFEDKEQFKKELADAAPAHHEKISALILLEKFKEKIEKNDAEPLLAARMILGCNFNSEEPIKKFENRLISLLNGKGIDVDSLDYIQRDSWASGVSNVTIDYHRLLSSILIRTNNFNVPVICFKKQVLSVLQNIVIGRNFLYQWIYSHHKVLYEQELLKVSVEDANYNFDKELYSALFNIDTLYEPKKVNGFSFYLPTDDDVIFTIKSFIDKSDTIKEFISRDYKKKALWKTYFEYDKIFRAVSKENRLAILGKLNNKALSEFNDPIAIEAKPKLKSLYPNDFYIDIDGELEDASKVLKILPENLQYFILYVNPEIFDRKKEILEKLLSLQN